MQIYIALFRAINVGGKNILPMKELTGILEQLGAEQVKTYIQSGNAVFTHSEKDAKLLSGKIISSIKKSKGFEPKLLLLKKSDMDKAVSTNPFPKAVKEPKTLHVFFMDSKPKAPNLQKMDEIKKDSEDYRLVNKFFYLHAPEGIGRSKLAAGAEKLLGVPTTARNWRTVEKLCEIVTDIKK